MCSMLPCVSSVWLGGIWHLHHSHELVPTFSSCWALTSSRMSGVTDNVPHGNCFPICRYADSSAFFTEARSNHKHLLPKYEMLVDLMKARRTVGDSTLISPQLHAASSKSLRHYLDLTWEDPIQRIEIRVFFREPSRISIRKTCNSYKKHQTQYSHAASRDESIWRLRQQSIPLFTSSARKILLTATWSLRLLMSTVSFNLGLSLASALPVCR